MSFRDIIETKKEGRELTEEQIGDFVRGVVRGEMPDYQISALLMAIVWRGMKQAEMTELTRAMTDSGFRIRLEELGSPGVDKHSTGGVGDKVTLILSPLVASAGIPVPMLSGRGLGHTGGTLDKLEAIPGFRTDLTAEEFRQVLREVGLAIMGQSAELAPADQKLYALRDVTATVESLPLIVASILSKKLASGVTHMVFDVKCGKGAFMHTRTKARSLARALVGTAKHLDAKAVALMSAMDQPLGCAVGNALEVRESIQALMGEVTPDVEEIVLSLGCEMMLLAGAAESLDKARSELKRLWEEGEALRKFRQLVVIQGGDARVVERPELLPQAPVQIPLAAARKGWVTGLHALTVGQIARDLGGGREKADDKIDPSVGIVFHKRIGDRTEKGEALAVIHAADKQSARAAKERLAKAYLLGPRQVKRPKIILGRVI